MRSRRHIGLLAVALLVAAAALGLLLYRYVTPGPPESLRIASVIVRWEQAQQLWWRLPPAMRADVEAQRTLRFAWKKDNGGQRPRVTLPVAFKQSIDQRWQTALATLVTSELASERSVRTTPSEVLETDLNRRDCWQMYITSSSELVDFHVRHRRWNGDLVVRARFWYGQVTALRSGEKEPRDSWADMDALVQQVNGKWRIAAYVQIAMYSDGSFSEYGPRTARGPNEMDSPPRGL